MKLTERFKLIKDQTSLSATNIILLLVSFAGLLFAAAIARPTMHEGSWWFYVILDTKTKKRT